MYSENNPMIVPLHFGQIAVLLTCLLKKTNLFPTGIRKKMFTMHSAEEFVANPQLACLPLILLLACHFFLGGMNYYISYLQSMNVINWRVLSSLRSNLCSQYREKFSGQIVVDSHQFLFTLTPTSGVTGYIHNSFNPPTP
jgi:hypothetical protein